MNCPSHRRGNKVTIPRTRTIPPEINVQVYGGILMKRVLTFNKNVEAMTEIPRDKTTVRAFFKLTCPSVIEPPTITGNRGKTHGARTVRIPAIKEIKKSNIKNKC